MSLHFLEGEYNLFQNNREVGRLVAVDVGPSSVAQEYWYLYYSIPSGDPNYEIYTAPSPNTDLVPTVTVFKQDVSVQWTFKYLRAPGSPFDPANPADYANVLKASLPAGGRALYIAATEVPCGGGSKGEHVRGVAQQVFGGPYSLFDGGGKQIGNLLVTPGLSSSLESWELNAGSAPSMVFADYERPPQSTAVSTSYRFQSGVGVSLTTIQPYCVECSVVLQ